MAICFSLPFLLAILSASFTNSSEDMTDLIKVFNLKLVQNIDLILCGERQLEDGRQLISKHYEAFASFSAVKLCTTIDRKEWTSLHDKNRIVIMLFPANVTKFITMIKYVSNIHGNDTFKWKPFWLLTWPNHCNSQDEITDNLEILKSVEVELRKSKLNSQVFILFYLLSNSSYIQNKVTVYEVYGVKDITIVEKYIPVLNLLDLEIMNNKAQRRHFHGQIITGIAVDDNKTELMTEFEDVNGETRFKSGLAVEAFRYVSQSLNFTGKAMKATEHLRVQTNGSVSGLGEALISSKADILVINSELLEQKMKELTFLPSFYSAQLSAYFIQPPASDFRNIYLQPFSSTVWLTLVFVWLGIISFLISFNFIKEKLQVAAIEESDDHQIAKESILWAIATITQNGWHISPTTSSMKTIFLTGCFTAVLTYTSYSAVIISTLSVVSDPIKSMHDLEKSGMAIFSDVILESSFNVVQAIARRKGLPVPKHFNDSSLKMDIPDVIARFISRKPTAVVTVDDFFYPPAREQLSDRYLCETVSKLKVSHPTIQGGMYIRAWSPFREHFKHRFLAFRENGVSKRNNGAYHSKAALSCTRNDEKMKQHKAFEMADVISAFALLFSAFIASWLVLNIEKVYFWHRMKNRVNIIPQIRF